MYHTYLCDLADELDCEIRFLARPDGGMMYVEFGYIETPNPNGTWRPPQQEFAVGLHELGHVFHGHTQGRPPKGHERHYFDNGVLHSEAQAWEFALDNFQKIGETIEPETRSFMWDGCLGSYWRASQDAGGSMTRLWNGDRHHVAFIYDKPDDYFWSIQQRILG